MIRPDPKQAFAPNGEFAFRTVAGEAVLVPIRKGITELGSIYTLNEVGAVVWRLVADGAPLSEMVDRVAQEFEVDRERARADVVGFLEGLLERGLVVPKQEGEQER